jgi:N6-adenosine-specific RNA methylase IME4
MYRTIVADPPWPYDDGFNGWGRRRHLPYEQMTLQQLITLPVRDLCEREGYLFLWATNRYLPTAFSLLREWRFTYRQTLTWDKGDVGSGLGGMFATNAEFILVAQNIRSGTNAHGARTHGERIPTSVFRWPRGEHSAKPEAFLDLVEQVSPGPYLELFARRQRLGWDTWGNEALEHVTLSATERAEA